MYKFLFRHFLTRLRPEDAHHLAFFVIKVIPYLGIGALAHIWTKPDASLQVKTLGLTFPSPFGLAAGPDKDGKSLRGLGQLGFGHIEVGTLTAIAQPGNPKPRLFRLVDDNALINRMGFNNGGAAAAAKRLAREYRRPNRPIIGANIGKSRVVEIDDAMSDYVASARILRDYVDYFVINVSSPNTPGLRGLQDPKALKPIVQAVIESAKNKPVLVKIAPDLSDSEVTQIAKMAVKVGSAGLVATNTTTARQGLRSSAAVVDAAGVGGLSGPPVAERAIEVLKLVRSVVPKDFCVISVGGVVSAEDVAQRLSFGADLVQGYTGFLYQGPLWARRINVGLAQRRAANVQKTAKQSHQQEFSGANSY